MMEHVQLETKSEQTNVLTFVSQMFSLLDHGGGERESQNVFTAWQVWPGNFEPKHVKTQSSHWLRPAFLQSNTPQRANSSKWPNTFCCTEAAVVNGFEFQRPSVDILLEERV